MCFIYKNMYSIRENPFLKGISRMNEKIIAGRNKDKREERTRVRLKI